MSGLSRELPMPNVTRIRSLGQAYATLQHCWIRLSRLWQGSAAGSAQLTSPIDAEDRRHFQLWLEQWEQAFTDYLSSARAAMDEDEVTCGRILKANHLACTLLASDGGPDLRSFDVFEAEFEAIVELAGAVTQSRHQADPSPSNPRSARAVASTPSALDVKDPLRVVASRCRRAVVRDRAVALLSRIRDR